MHLNLAPQFELGDAPQVLAKDFFLYLKLMFVGRMLVVAPAATAVVRTGGRHAMRRRLDDLRRLRASEACLFFRERRFDFLPGKNERNEHSLSARPVFGI